MLLVVTTGEVHDKERHAHDQAVTFQEQAQREWGVAQFHEVKADEASFEEGDDQDYSGAEMWVGGVTRPDPPRDKGGHDEHEPYQADPVPEDGPELGGHECTK
jgi:hypothetical protein